MNTVPNIISTKDLSYISDMINWNLTAGKCANHYIQECDMEEVKSILNKVKNMHKNHVQILVDTLGGAHEQ